ncbi:MAG: kelch repeat-containing protein, partial [Thermoanaerobaculia bacterium]
VLVAGGWKVFDTPDASAELYDPVIGAFSMTALMNLRRVGPSMTLLDTGDVLIAGGQVVPRFPLPPGSPYGTTSAEIYRVND